MASSDAPYGQSREYSSEERQGATQGYANTYVDVDAADSTIFKSASADARASYLHINQTQDKRKIESVEADVFSAQAGTTVSWVGGDASTVPTYLGAEAGLYLFKGRGGPFEASLGAGVDTGIGFKDQSAQVHLLGCGVSVGRKIGISAFGNSFSIDFGNLLG